MGDVAPEHDPATAIRVAIRAGIRLKISAGLDPAQRAYFDAEVRPLLGHPLIEWVGEADERTLVTEGPRLLEGSAPMQA